TPHTEFLCPHLLAEHEPETVVLRIVMDRVALELDQLEAIEAVIGRRIPVTPSEEREEGCVEPQALAAFAPGWVGDELERRLCELTDPDLGRLLREWREAADRAVEE